MNHDNDMEAVLKQHPEGRLAPQRAQFLEREFLAQVAPDAGRGDARRVVWMLSALAALAMVAVVYCVLHGNDASQQPPRARMIADDEEAATARRDAEFLKQLNRIEAGKSKRTLGYRLGGENEGINPGVQIWRAEVAQAADGAFSGSVSFGEGFGLTAVHVRYGDHETSVAEFLISKDDVNFTVCTWKVAAEKIVGRQEWEDLWVQLEAAERSYWLWVPAGVLLPEGFERKRAGVPFRAAEVPTECKKGDRVVLWDKFTFQSGKTVRMEKGNAVGEWPLDFWLYVPAAKRAECGGMPVYPSYPEAFARSPEFLLEIARGDVEAGVMSTVMEYCCQPRIFVSVNEFSSKNIEWTLATITADEESASVALPSTLFVPELNTIEVPEGVDVYPQQK